MATLKDIAKIANVTVSTASKALRGSNDVSPKTVMKIKEIAEQLNYTRANHMRTNYTYDTNTTPLVGIVWPEITSMFYADVLKSLQRSLLEKGFQSLVMISDFNREQEESCINTLVQKNICGIVFFTVNEVDSEYIKSLSHKGITSVIVSHNSICDFCDNICIDDNQSVALAINHLIELNHKKIAFVGDALTTIRNDLFIQALKGHAMTVNPDYIIKSDLRFEECGYHGMKKLLALDSPPTAILAAYDNIAFGAMRAIYESGYSIPEDFSVIGIDNLKTSAYLSKALTSVNEPTADLGDLAAELMVNKLHKKTAVQQIKLVPTLNIRETTAAALNR